jgi:protease-4
MSRSSTVFLLVVGIVLVGLLASVALFGWLALREGEEGGSASIGFGDKVAVVEVTGVILDSRSVVEALHRHGENRSIKAIVLRLDTPGGAVAPSQEIYQEVLRVSREKKKPVVASMASVAASGGYYIASAADEIWANPGSITGSIGVIMQWTNYAELLRWAKLRPETITSGPFKDAGNPTREMTDEERAYFQGIIDELRNQFVEDVAEGRKGKLTVEEVDGLADGRVFAGTEAKELKLVDSIGDLHDAIDRAAVLGKIPGEPTVVHPRPRPSGLWDMLGEGLFGGKLDVGRLSPAGGGYRFYFLW